MAVATVITHLYKEYFGLNEDEVILLLKYYGIELTEDIKAMYNGYNFAGLEIYNPWSILNYARQRQLISYWVNTSTNALIRKTILNADKFFYESFDKLILNKSVSINARLDTSFFEMKNVDTLWGLLINAGYITITGEPDYENDRYTIKIPNKEVKKEFQAIVSSYININESSLKNMFYYLLNKDIDEFSKIYKGIIEQVTSYYDAKENAYHMLMLGMCIYLDSYYDIKSNIEAGDGRCDIMLTALNDKYTNILIEFKQGDDVKSLAKTALNQIHSKKYYGSLQGDTLLLGIAHNKKQVYIEHEMLFNNVYK